MNTYIVTAAVITDQDRVLITQRKKNSNQGLKWEFPGGKMEEGEDPEGCLIREIKEELDIDIAVQDIFKVVMHRYGDRNILLLAYLCSHAGGDPAPLECNNIAWVPVKRLMDFDLAAADVPVAAKLQEVSDNAKGT
ncbi:MAG: NUDIX hydrolase [Peptococcaceae bacterium BRH_c4a]|nr:MAG: NUDIX hydrolase [Peptococcaceae bacterium BRH_c4a]